PETVQDEVGKIALNRTNLSMDVKYQQDVVEGGNQVAITLLGLGNDLEDLIQLLIAGRLRVPLFDAAQKATQLGNLPGLFPQVDAEKGDQHDEADGERFKVMRQRANRAPGGPGISENQKKKNQEGEPPGLTLAFFEAVQARGDGGTAGLFGRWAPF